MIANETLVFISGASGGLGSECAKILAKKGHPIAVGYCTNADSANRVVGDIQSSGNNARAYHFDYQSRNVIRDAFTNMKNDFGCYPAVLINNGAIAQEKPFDTISDTDWATMLSTNLQGPFIAAQELIPSMLEHNWGRIINISSIGGQWGGFNQVHYAAAKAGLINFTQSLAKIYSKQGIASTAIAIGLVDTKMSARELNSEAGKEKVKGIPAGRLANTKEIAETLAYLISDDGAYLTGQTLNMNGGMYFN